MATKPRKAVVGPVFMRLTMDGAPLVAALRSLEELAKLRPEIVKRFLRGRSAFSKLFRVDADVCTTRGARQYSVLLQPSDRLVKFLAAARAGNV